MVSAFTQNIPEAKFTSLILLPERVTQPNYSGKSMTFIWQAGQSAMLVRKTRGVGGLDVLAVDLNVDSWTRLITGGLAQGIVKLC